jgi:hypothetical protein
MGELKTLLDVEAERFEPSTVGLDRTIARARRRTNRRRLLAGALALTVAAAGLALAVEAIGPGNATPASRSDLHAYRDPLGLWEISYPKDFKRGSVPHYGMVSLEESGIWIANYTPTFRRSGPSFANVPDTGVAVEFLRVAGPLIEESPDTSTHVTVADLTSYYSGAWPSASLQVDGLTYRIEVAEGARASAANRAAVTDVVESLRFLPVREGTMIGYGWSYLVLGRPTAYPVGSVTRFDGSNVPFQAMGQALPFYLVHVPEGFYALTWAQEAADGKFGDCGVTYDPATLEFSCPGGGRWSVDGKVITKPAPGYPDQPSNVLLVRLSSDGHVLVTPNTFMSDPRVDLGLTG